MNPWFPYLQRQPNASLRLLCFHYASGSAAMYRHWQAPLSPQIELWPLQLPGRERRLMEPSFQRMETLIDSVVEVLRPWLQDPMPWACFGYSMGALVGFAVLRRLRDEGLPLPVHFFPAACRAPHFPNPNAMFHGLPDNDLIAELRRFGGTPDEVLDNAELMELILPTMRADLAVCELYRYQEKPALPVPITAFGGEHDPDIVVEGIHGWKEHTSDDFKAHLFGGGHLFLDEYEPAIWQVLRETLVS